MSEARPRRTAPEILPVMVGTAGHVDHGKSALVELLTGCSMDRHPEAQARGLTIDLGFAPCRLPGNRLAGIVDVPGHEDFIRNMVAGAASIDVLLLVVAADDGIMPQTREHLQIVQALRTPLVMAVVTKIDLVEAEMRAVVAEELRAFLAEAGYGEAPILYASSVTLEGVDAVRQTLQELVGRVRPAPDPRGFRMFAERSFSVRGHGTVVTGIPVCGELHPEDAVSLLPGGTRHAVRAIQSYKLDRPVAHRGACAAVNLRDLDAADVQRGQALAAPGCYEATGAAVVHLRLTGPDAALKRRTDLRLHAGTAHVNTGVRLLAADALVAGECGPAELVLEEPLCLSAGDRFVLRSLSPPRTLGGGRVLSVRPGRLRASDPDLAGRLEEARAALAEAGGWFAAELLAGEGPLVDGRTLDRLTRCPGEAGRRCRAAAVERGLLRDLGGGLWLVAPRVAELRARLAGMVRRFHAGHPQAPGLAPAQVAAALGVPAASAEGLVALAAEAPELTRQRGRLALAGFAPSLTQRQEEILEAMRRRVHEGGMRPPARGDLQETLGASDAEMRLAEELLVDEGVLVPVGVNLLARGTLEACRQKVLELAAANGKLTLNEFRRATGAGRNLCVAVLEHFDDEGLTRRIGNERELLAGPASEGEAP